MKESPKDREKRLASERRRAFYSPYLMSALARGAQRRKAAKRAAH